jgi:uncharacterized lipoprotein YddW (UPF0748 family)
MKFRSGILSAFISFLPAILCGANFVYRPVSITLPQPAREFRGAWITAVATNQDWPSKPGLSVADQKAELISLLDRAVQLHLNAIIFQVRPACDAMYASSIEPWSEYISGTMGKPPQPFYDPLAFAIAEAHKRGLELHAWFNPFRAVHPLAKITGRAEPHHPDASRNSSAVTAMQLWLDPGEPCRARIRFARGDGRGAALRRGRRAVRRLFLSLPGEGCVGAQIKFPRRRELEKIRRLERLEPRRLAAA